MQLTKVQKVGSGVVIGIMMMTASMGAVFAQDDDTVTDTDEPLCVVERTERENVIDDLLDELELTREEVRDYDGTLEELLAENGVDLEALRAENQAENQATRTANMLACVTTLEENGSLTAEQADNLRTAIEDGSFQTLREEGFGGRNGERGNNGRDRNGRGGRNNAGGFFGNGIFGDSDDAPELTPEATTEADA
ncbi:MAG: hypothetical protein Phog2KO_26710 [Phototrophicaceae bacterium]